LSIKPIELDQSIPERPWERAVLQAVRGLRYGSVEVVVHDGHVVQIERREKVRLADQRPPDHRTRTTDTSGRADRATEGTALRSDEKENA
jgi:hypothetical protein